MRDNPGGKPLSVLLRGVPGIRVLGPLGGEGPCITGLAYDSRLAARGCLFFALDGVHTDGSLWISAAARAGAAAVLSGKDEADKIPGLVYIWAENPRAAMSRISSFFYGRPSSRLVTLGVTGTDGKSSTVYFIYQLLESMGKRAGLLSTVSFLAGGGLEKNPYRQSTPEAPVIHGALADMAAAGKEYAVIEATSHGLSARTGRLLDVEFDAAVVTNVTHEHLEFHGTREQYLSDKANLFRRLSSGRSSAKGVPAFGVVNLDDGSSSYIMGETRERVFSYSVTREDADVYASGLAPDMGGTDFFLHDGGAGLAAAGLGGGSPVKIRLPIPGAFNVENVLAAALAVSRVAGVSAMELAPHIEKLAGVRGRMTSVPGAGFTVLVDYAHTPGSFERLFPMARAYTAGKIIAVFGSGGERDREKRPIQGRIASAWADIVILADEDPRGEDREALLREIASGCAGKEEGRDLFIIPERREAIRRAFSLAGRGDTVLLLGKGHETSIIGKDGPAPWDEIEAARELLGPYAE